MVLKNYMRRFFGLILFCLSCISLQAASGGKLPDNFEFIVEGIYPKHGGQVLILKGYDHQHYRVLYPNSIEVHPTSILGGDDQVKKQMIKVLDAPAKLTREEMLLIKKAYEDYQEFNDSFELMLDVQMDGEQILSQYSKEYLALIRNTVYAKAGYIFKTEKYKKIFSKKPWYKPTTNNPKLDKSEQEFVALLKKYESRK